MIVEICCEILINSIETHTIRQIGNKMNRKDDKKMSNNCECNNLNNQRANQIWQLCKYCQNVAGSRGEQGPYADQNGISQQGPKGGKGERDQTGQLDSVADSARQRSQDDSRELNQQGTKAEKEDKAQKARESGNDKGSQSELAKTGDKRPNTTEVNRDERDQKDPSGDTIEHDKNSLKEDYRDNDREGFEHQGRIESFGQTISEYSYNSNKCSSIVEIVLLTGLPGSTQAIKIATSTSLYTEIKCGEYMVSYNIYMTHEKRDLISTPSKDEGLEKGSSGKNRS